jgi:hypothetical protein
MLYARFFYFCAEVFVTSVLLCDAPLPVWPGFLFVPADFPAEPFFTAAGAACGVDFVPGLLVDFFAPRRA